MSDDFGIKVSKKGYDAAGCADRNLLTSSSFRNLEVLFEGEFWLRPGDNNDGHVINICPHNAGFYPAFLVFYKAYDTQYPEMDWGWENFEGAVCNTEGLFINQYANTGSTQSYRLHYIVFDYDLEEAYLAPTILDRNEVANALETSSIFQIAKTGIDAYTTKPNEMNISSNFSSLIVHKSGKATSPTPVQGDPASTTTHIFHNLGYIPLFYIWTKAAAYTYAPHNYTMPGGYYMAGSCFYFQGAEGLDWQTRINSSELIMTADTYVSTGVEYAYIIFKGKVA